MDLNSANPTLLYAYGGFEVPMLPFYSGTFGNNWLENGGVFVLANIRGGGEFGPRWHQAGLKANRQRVYDDFHEMIRLAKETGTWTALEDVDNLIVPPDLQKAFDANPTAFSFWQKFPPSTRRGILEWIFNV